jgi:hypothetical protein
MNMKISIIIILVLISLGLIIIPMIMYTDDTQSQLNQPDTTTTIKNIKAEQPPTINIPPSIVTPVVIVNMDSLRNEHRKGQDPSYCDPTKYKIQVIGNKFVACLPYGTSIGSFSSIEDAQNAINENVKLSKQRWDEYGSF